MNQELAAAAPSTAYELGSAMALVKFAQERPEREKNYLLSRLSPYHSALIAEYQAAANQK